MYDKHQWNCDSDPVGGFAILIGSRRLALAAGVTGITAQSFQFDGLSRMTVTQDSVGSTNANVTLVYDSLSRVLEESESY